MRLTTTSGAGEPYTIDLHNQTVWRRDDGIGWKIASDHNVAAQDDTAM